MCGIFGNFCFYKNNLSENIFSEMADSIKHRGPDNSSFIRKDNFALGNTRLAILDPSEKSNQPIISDDKTIFLVQNGEIYNFIELRDELKVKGFDFETDGDSEVLLKAYLFWGEDFVSHLNGMFSIAIFDKRKESLLIFRDRLGIKPLFYFFDKEKKIFWFASEIKAFIKTGIVLKPNIKSLAEFLGNNFVPGKTTAFEDINHLDPGCFALINVSGICFKRYWDINKIHVNNDMNEAEAQSKIIKILDDATRIRLRSDAKYGAFLSGGLDSSSVVGFMNIYEKTPIKTYSIGFEEKKFDETFFAKKASKRFGTLHRLEYMKFLEIKKLWARFIWHAEQPHGDVSFMPLDILSSIASKDVKMVLTGDGGDELFAGYKKYANYFQNFNNKLSIEEIAQDYSSKNNGVLNNVDFKSLLIKEILEEFINNDPHLLIKEKILEANNQDAINRILIAEISTLLANNNLVKADRMSMANSLETRSPFLDHRLVKLAFNMKGSYKLKGNCTKYILKKSVKNLLGEELTYREKSMLTVPIGEWFKNSLSLFVKELLLSKRFFERELFSELELNKIIIQHQNNQKNHTRLIRALISLEIWYRLFIDKDQDWLAQVN